MNKHAQALGRIKTKKKAKASRLNGKLGGYHKQKRNLTKARKQSRMISTVDNA